MNTVKIYGHSDDCVEIECIEGNVDGCDEHFSSGKKDYIVFSGYDDYHGEIFSIEYTTYNNDLWEIECVSSGQSLTVWSKSFNLEKGTDIVYVTGNFEWVRFIGPNLKLAEKFARIKHRTLEKAENVIMEVAEQAGGLDHLSIGERNSLIISVCEMIEG